MDYQIYEASQGDREKWNSFMTRNGGSFLQSWEWGQFQQSFGRSCRRLKIPSFAPPTPSASDGHSKASADKKDIRFENDAGQALVIKYDLPLGRSYLYCPRGPVIDLRFKIPSFAPPTPSASDGHSKALADKKDLRMTMEVFIEKIKEVGKQENAVFLRIDPGWEDDNNSQLLKSIGFHKHFKEIQPQKTVIIDLTKSEKELLAAMHAKTRYNIRLAQKRGVRVAPQSTTYDQGPHFEKFWTLLQETAKRDGFRTHAKEYYQKQLDQNLWQFSHGRVKIAKGFENKLFMAEYRGKAVAGAIVNFWGQRATYLHGASDYGYRNLMGPHILHWGIMKYAKSHGFREYDFWGIDEKKWPGLTKFKKGFGGKETVYTGAYDYVLHSFWYTFYRWLKKSSGHIR